MDKKLKKQLKALGDDFHIGILKAAASGNPGNFGILFELGNAYTHTGQYEDGLRIDRELIKLRPEDPVVRYNLACSLSLLGQLDEAFQEIEESFRLGYSEYNYALSDPDLENLRKDRRFAMLLERYMHADH